MKTILTVVGARPQLVKAAPLSRALQGRGREVLVHTGQHYDWELDGLLWKELGLPSPDYHLGIGSGSHGEQTGRMLVALEQVMLAERPDWVVVLGDTNSTLAGALAASKLRLPLAHVEAGMRSGDRGMPEEQNRVVADHLADLLLTSTAVAEENLHREGILRGVHRVGDLMKDALELFRGRFTAEWPDVFPRCPAGEYAVATIHRAENTERAERLAMLLQGLGSLPWPVLLPLHPRTRKALEGHGLALPGSVHAGPPLGYLEMLGLVQQSRVVLTDSGGLQKEAFLLGIPCITLRDVTEWVETVEVGWNRLAGADAGRIRQAAQGLPEPGSVRPELYGDGHGADEIVALLVAEPLRAELAAGSPGARAPLPGTTQPQPQPQQTTEEGRGHGGAGQPAAVRSCTHLAPQRPESARLSGAAPAPAPLLTVAVTGSAGFIGSHLVDRLLALGHRVHGVDNLSFGLRENFEHHLGHPGFRFHKVDVRDEVALAEATADCDAFVHLAALKIPRYGNALATLQVNHAGAANVLELARQRCRKVVLASTSDVYGMNPELPFQEEGNLVLGPPTVKRWSYAVSKLYDEHLALAYAEEYRLPVVALRFFGSYGPRHHLSWWGGPQSVFFEHCFAKKPLPIHGDGLQTRSFTFIDDLVEGIVAALLRPEADGQVLNLGSDEEVTILELAREVHRASGVEGELQLEFIPYRSFTGKRYDDVRRRVPDCSRAAQLLGWQARVRLADGLALTAPWHRMAMTGRVSAVREPPAVEATR